MVGREADRARMVGDVVEAQWAHVLDEHAEDAPALGKIADRPVCLLVDAGREEALQAAPLAVDDAERRVAGVGQLGRRLDDPLEHGVQRELRGQRDARLDEGVQAALMLLDRHGAILSFEPLRSGARTTPPTRLRLRKGSNV